MKNFYWKTFLRFSAISLVLLLTISGLYFAFIYEKPFYAPNKPMFASYASAAVSVYEYGGKKALADWLTHLEDERHIQIYLLDDEGHDVLNRTLPNTIQEAIANGTEWQETTTPHSGSHKGKKKEKIIFSQALSKVGDTYILASSLPPSPPPHHHSTNAQTPVDTAQSFGLRIFSLMAIGGLLCVWITWYLTRPVNQLRRATQEWSTGNLSARVSNNLGNRQDDISALGRDLDRMAERLQEIMESKERLLRDISHELRTPLARLQIALGLARKRSHDVAKEEFDRIELEAERLNEMIGQILSITRLDSLTEIDKESVDLDELLKKIINNAEFENILSNKLIKLNIEENSKKIRANANLLYSALENVIRNALRYTPEHTSIDVQVAKTKDNQIKISVRDYGPGVPEATLTKLFEPFFRVADARERNTGGYGLGLAIVKRAIELHGGKILAANANDGGLIIIILLPTQEDSLLP